MCAKTDFDYPYRFCVAMVGNLESYSVNAKGTQSDIEQRPVDLIAPWGINEKIQIARK